MGRAVGYIRVSQVGARAGESFLSPDVQREKIEAWASYRGHELVGWYVDLDRPAKEGDRRPEFDRLMADAAAGVFDAVAVYRLSRFARSVSDAARRYSELRRLGIDLASVTEDFDTATSSGRLVQNMLFALAEFESQRIGEEWRTVHLTRRRRGIAHVSRPILGYRLRDGSAEIEAVDEEEAQVVRLIFDLRARGEGYGAIRRELERRGIRPKGGGERFAKSSLERVLRNPVYAGLVLAGDELVDARHPAIIDRDTWERVQVSRERIGVRARFTGAGLLVGLVECASCGHLMQRGSVSSGKRIVYRCGSRSRSNPCARPVAIAADLLDSYLEQEFLRRLDPNLMPNRGRVRRRGGGDWQDKVAALRARAADLTRAIDTLTSERFLIASLTSEEFDRQVSRFAGERARVIEEADAIEVEASAARPLDVGALDLWPSIPLDAKRKAIRAGVRRVTIQPATVRGGAHGRGIDPDRVSVDWII